MSIDKYFTRQQASARCLTKDDIELTAKHISDSFAEQPTKYQLDYLQSKIGTYRFSFLGLTDDDDETKEIAIYSDEFDAFQNVLSFIKYKDDLPLFLITNIEHFVLIYNALRTL